MACVFFEGDAEGTDETVILIPQYVQFQSLNVETQAIYS